MSMSRFLFIGTEEDKPYLGYLSKCVDRLRVDASLAHFETLYQVRHLVKKHNYTGVFTTSVHLLNKLLGNDVKLSTSEESIANYAGSYFLNNEVEFVILPPLKRLITVPYGQFLAAHYITKLTEPSKWLPVPAFDWTVGTPENLGPIYDRYQKADLIAIDIETAKEPIRIISISYTAIFSDYTSHTVVFNLDSEYMLTWIGKFNSLPAKKIFQNGKYDNAYLTRYNVPVHNYMLDTANLFHCWYSELPKDLGALQAFCVRTGAYWKDLAKSGNAQDHLLYNALDTWATACSALVLIHKMPQWAINNYLNEFPLNFPCHMSEMLGIPRDMEALTKASKQQEEIITSHNAELDTMLGTTGFNVASPKQKKLLLTVLGCADIAAKSTDEKSLAKAAYRHPLNARIISNITKVQKARKLKSTYLTPGKEFNDTILYALNPHGTDTSRLASREHHFWCGLNIQNIPRGKIVKSTMVALPGWRLGECDLEQAESRDTAYAAGEEKLIAAVSGDKDFHSLNAASFFGVSYEDIWDVIKHKAKDTERRDLGKKVNHGANYLMGAQVLVDTMGEKNIYLAAKLLKLPAHMCHPKMIAEYLLKKFHDTYPGLSLIYYPRIVAEIMTTRMITSRATHECKYQASKQGLVRYCFDNPQTNKQAKNAYVAHVSQSLNAMTLNKSYMQVFYDVAMHPEHKHNFRLLAQIHDSILFMFREGHEYLGQMVKERMEIPVTIKGYDNKIRTFTVPAALKMGDDGKGAKSWAEI